MAPDPIVSPLLPRRPRVTRSRMTSSNIRLRVRIHPTRKPPMVTYQLAPFPGRLSRSHQIDRSRPRSSFSGRSASGGGCPTANTEVCVRIRRRGHRSGRGCQTQPGTLEQVLFTPRYTSVKDDPKLETTFLGQRFAAPFGVAPLGLSGLIWPRSARMLAQAARQHNLPFTLSNFGTDALEKIAAIGGEHAWFQLYPPRIPEIESSHIERLKVSGYETMIVTVDTPTAHRRSHDIRNGLSVPPRIDIWNVLQMMSRPRWAFEQLRYRPLTFENFERYIPAGASLAERGRFLVDILEGHIHRERLERLRESWPGKLIVKGLMHPEDAKLCAEVGADALVVSNHGGASVGWSPRNRRGSTRYSTSSG